MLTKEQADLNISVDINLGDVAPASPDPVAEGREAWKRINTAAKMMRDDWRKVGEALRHGRQLHRSNQAFGQWCRDNGFSDIDPRRRSDAMWLAENWNAVFKAVEDDICHPTHIRAAYGKASNEAECNSREGWRQAQSRRRKPVVPHPETLVRDPEVKAKLELGRLKLAVAGGYVEGSTHLESFVSIYNSQITGHTVFSHMQSAMMKSLADGDNLATAKAEAMHAAEEMRKEIDAHLDYAFRGGAIGLDAISEKMNKAGDSMLSMAFRPDTPVPEATTAARMCLRRMGFDPETDV